MTLYLDPTPLLDVARAGRPWHTPGCLRCERSSPTNRAPLCVTERDVADVIGVERRTVARWLAGARVDERHADRYAVAAGTHAYLLWPELDDAATAAVTRACAHPDCTNRFVPRTSRHRFCSNRCRVQSPEHKAKDRAKSAAYRAANPDEFAAYQAAYRAANRDRANRYRRSYYRRHREQIIAQNVERRRQRRTEAA